MRHGTTYRLLAFVLLAGAAGACGDDDTGPPPNAQETVNVEDSQFDPSSLTVTTGATVTWNWSGGLDHNVTWVAAGGPAASATQSSGSYQRLFGVAGSYDYYCTIHGTPTSGMRGSITVN